jgi:hypothetical protein
MNSVVSWLRQSTTGHGFALLVVTGVTSVVMHFTTNPQILGLVGILTGAVVLIVWPEDTGEVPAQSQTLLDIITDLSMAVADSNTASRTAASNHAVVLDRIMSDVNKAPPGGKSLIDIASGVIADIEKGSAGGITSATVTASQIPSPPAAPAA